MESVRNLTIRVDNNQSLTAYIVKPPPKAHPEHYALEVRVTFASSYIQQEVLKCVETKNESELRQWLQVAAGKCIAGSLAGHFFEAFAHRQLQAGGTFQMKELSSGQPVAGALAIPCSNALCFRELSELKSLS